MRFVPVKSTEQQDLQSLHRARERVVCARTALINPMRGLLGEYGVILPQGPWRFLKQAQDAIAAADLSDLARGLFADLFDELQALDLSTSGSTSWIKDSRAFAGRTKLAGGCRSCRASVR
jgi:transposase